MQLGPAWPQGRLGGVRAWGRGLVNVPGLGILITRAKPASFGLAGGRSAKRLFSFPRFRANRLSLAGSRRGLTMASTVRAHRLLPRRCRQHRMARDASSRTPVGFHALCNRELLTGQALHGTPPVIMDRLCGLIVCDDCAAYCCSIDEAVDQELLRRQDDCVSSAKARRANFGRHRR